MFCKKDVEHILRLLFFKFWSFLLYFTTLLSLHVHFANSCMLFLILLWYYYIIYRVHSTIYLLLNGKTGNGYQLINFE